MCFCCLLNPKVYFYRWQLFRGFVLQNQSTGKPFLAVGNALGEHSIPLCSMF